MALTKYTPTARGKTAKKVFTLTGTLLKDKGNSILVQKVNSKARFGIDKEFPITIAEGEIGYFGIIANTYAGKNDNIIRTKLRLIDAETPEEEITEEHPGFHDILKGFVKEVIKTDDDNIWLVRFVSEGCTYGLRLYSTKDPSDIKDKTLLTIDLNLSSLLFNPQGDIFESKKDVYYKDKDGNMVSKTVNNWFTCLTIKSGM